MPSIHPVLRPFEQHGVLFETPDDPKMTDAKAYCIFCEHESPKFFVNVESGQWHCKLCDRNGNVNTFLSQLLDLCLERTPDEFYAELAEERPGIPVDLFRDHRFAWHEHPHHERACWIFPVNNSRGNPINLKSYQYQSQPHSTTGLGLGLYRLEHLNATGPILICEGEWDALALEALRRRVNARGSILAAPGAAVFKKDWYPLFRNRDVYFLYDNDSAGYDNSRKHAAALATVAASVSVLNWPADCPPKYDIRDYCIANQTAPRNAFEDLFRMSERIGGTGEDLSSPEHEVTLKENTFEEVVVEFSKYFHFDSSSRNALALMAAVTFSAQLPGDPLWLFIVSPPGSGKTLLLRSFEKSPYCIFRSSITPKSLVSGYPGEGVDDPSLIPKLKGKCFICKDYTELMTASRQDQDEIYGILRGAYDGRCEKTFGNGVQRLYTDCHFAMLAGVTDEIHRDNRASLGERFLKFQMIEGHLYDPSHHIAAAIDLDLAAEAEAQAYLRSVMRVFSNRQLTTPPIVPKEIRQRIVNLAQIIAWARTIVPRDQAGDPLYRVGVEVGTRLAKQLVKLTQCLAFVHDPHCTEASLIHYALAEKVAFDTGTGWALDILRLLAENPTGEPLSSAEIAARADVPPAVTRRRLNDLTLLGVVRTVKAKKVLAGQPAILYALSDHFAALWSGAFPTPVILEEPNSAKRKRMKTKKEMVAERKRRKTRKDA